ncbi:hypothetical protein DYB25_013829 [Aphanomyces astaci]|uniref:HTH psq-type domain-containing protein n=1 Tax=Aphanomyces astaci TaxID=112090 RepID=A0A397CDS2_APHAT|nr:hypothetical protein DYB25_013829 [Aphanomyces astaci]RHY44659.1 hypothetical protein DYB30_012759 [Aphanomyces astaci]RHY49312.1 hypothetical protein DYB34_009436 [Aphanomyces astaci]RHY98738.1 hypothetical protein DYB31_015013 [Aphanomyces astaci]
MPARRYQLSYSIDRKRELIARFDNFGLSGRKFRAMYEIPRNTWKSWKKQRAKFMTTRRNAKHKTLGGQGAKIIIPFQHDLLTFMKDVRRDEHILTSMHMINFMKTHYYDWLTAYMSDKVDPYKSILRLCQSFTHQHRFYEASKC